MNEFFAHRYNIYRPLQISTINGEIWQEQICHFNRCRTKASAWHVSSLPFRPDLPVSWRSGLTEKILCKSLWKYIEIIDLGTLALLSLESNWKTWDNICFCWRTFSLTCTLSDICSAESPLCKLWKMFKNVSKKNRKPGPHFPTCYKMFSSFQKYFIWHINCFPSSSAILFDCCFMVL